jgi:radical SAM protein with 4Fe4S-binding SPASM domain
MELTSKCNLNCKACYRSGSMREYMNLNVDMSMDNLIKLLANYNSKKVNSIILSGGENLLHQNFFEALNIIRKRFVKSEILLSTNGVILSNNRDILKKVCSSEINTIQVSIHGATQETINLLQKGINLDKLLEVISYIRENSEIKITVNYVIQDENINEVLPFLDIMAKIKVQEISLHPMNYAGHTNEEINYNKLWGKMNLDKVLSEAYMKAKEIGISIWPFNPICTSIFDVDVLTADGDMLPCWGPYLAKKYAIGNVFVQHPDEIRKNSIIKELQKSIIFGYNNNRMCDSCWANGRNLK